MNSTGNVLRMHVFGESHAKAIGVILDGVPSGISIDEDGINSDLKRRKPNAMIGGTARSEEDRVKILSGVSKGKSTGSSITLLLENRNIKPKDYSDLRFKPRPGHADFTSFLKYGEFPSGGGIFSGRMTASFVMAGSIAKKIAQEEGIEVFSHVVKIGKVKGKLSGSSCFGKRRNILGSVDNSILDSMKNEIDSARKMGDSVGGEIETIAKVPPGLGEPLFGSIESEISRLVFSIPSVKGITFGTPKTYGSENNDEFIIKNGKIATRTNNSGGILGGITNGMPLIFTTLFKPVPSISKKQKTIDLRTLKETEITIQGRHDSCVLPRAVVVVEAMACFALADLSLLSKRCSNGA